MSGIGFWELIILFLIGLIVLGPERLPRVANQIGSWLGQARRMTRIMKRQLEDELGLDKHLRIKPSSFLKSKNDQDSTYSPAHDIEIVDPDVSNDSADDTKKPGSPVKVKTDKKTT
jgi:sec-independent protein translocase protein TatB